MEDLKKFNFAIAHVGINCENSAEAQKVAQAICDIFGFECTEMAPSFFAGSAVEVMKRQARGTKGHVGIATDDILGSIDALKARGYKFIEDSIAYNPDGSMRLIYFEGEIGGFAFHLDQRRIEK